MTMIETARIIEVAEQAREDFDQQNVDRDLLAQLYGDYHPGGLNISNFLRKAIPAFPIGSCGVASVYLRHRLEAGEPRYGTYMDFGHTVLVIGELIADITADQFGGPEVYVGPLVEPWFLRAEDHPLL